eukprot:scaffold88008_cov61-Phaeocystis_antarctica.AAC.1
MSATRVNTPAHWVILERSLHSLGEAKGGGEQGLCGSRRDGRSCEGRIMTPDELFRVTPLGHRLSIICTLRDAKREGK